MADDNRLDLPRRSVRKVSQNSYIKLRNAKTELREKVRKVSEVLRKPEHERSCADKALVTKHPEIVKTSQRNAKRLKENKDRQLEIEDEPAVLSDKCERLADLIKSSEHVIVYTGAGISTAASIPDYRGPNGVWTLLKKGQGLSPQDLSDAEPTYTHMCLTKLFRVKKVKHVVSQNCDGLHIRSGFPRYSLSELHGNMYIEMCYNCAPHREYVRLFDVTERTSVRRHTTSRRCRACGVNLTDTIVHFGEKGKIKSPYRWKEAVRAARKADLILCLGTSLKVLKKYQCLWCMDKKPHLRPKLAIVNLQWTPKDDVATLKINGRCDSVMRMVMKLLDEEVPEYQRELDPIFRICTPLRAIEMKTTSKKILIPPAQLARPPKQTKNSKNKEKPAMQMDCEQSCCLTKSDCGSETTEITEKVEFTAGSDVSITESLPTCNTLSTGTGSLPQCLSDADITSQHVQQTISSEPPDVSASMVSVTVENKCSASIVDSTPSMCQIKPELPAQFLSSTASHLLKSQSLTSSQAQTPVVNTSAAQETFVMSASGTNHLINLPSEPVILNSSWPSDIMDTAGFEQAGSNIASGTMESSSHEERVPTIVVVNLDTPADTPPLFHPPKQNIIIETANSFTHFSSKQEVECSTLVLGSSTSHSHDVADASQDISPFPVLLTYLNDAGHPLSIPLNSSIPHRVEDTLKATPSSVPVIKNAQFGNNISLDHSYFHDTGNNRKATDASAFAQNSRVKASKDSSVREHRASAGVPSKTSCDTSDSNSPSDRSFVARKSQPNTMAPQLSSSKLTSQFIKPESCPSSAESSNLSTFSSVSSGVVTAPMCVLNMDEMETIYTLPEEPSHLLAPVVTTSRTTAEVEDITLEFQLPFGCEILTMDMLSATPPVTLDYLPNNPDAQVLTQKGTGGWQTLNLGNVMQTMNTDEPLVNSILSSALEPVVCNLAVDSTQTVTKGVGVSSTKPTGPTQVLTVCLDDGTGSGLTQTDQRQPAQDFTELTRLLRGTYPGPPAAVHKNNMVHTHHAHCTKKSAPSVAEERKPLSPRSSELSFSSQATTPTALSLPSSNVNSYCNAVVVGKPMLSPGKDQGIKIKKEEKGNKEPKVPKQSCQSKNLAKGILNHVKVEGKPVGLENICRKVSNPKCSPAAVPGWFGKGLGLKKKRK
ncbi:NAD-dependent deacetylase sirtuin-7 [Elysia marginata]|uniref:protein acetyllysine N-acetyltransferase n=1 Tax=Elysia marginata TaxID=1093978 RepID=A0AAV4FPP4_9GAST|nr:NAD-dependent deacetylase sirtuin-7 [Elysia marginata]